MSIDCNASHPAEFESTCAIWNPAAATVWSLLFTPAFGAFIHMLNWQALGQPEQAASAKKWFYASLALLMLQIVTRALNARFGTEPWLVHPLGLLFFPVWYVCAARAQTRLVRARFGASYVRKSWNTVLMGAVMAGAVYALASALLSLVLLALT
ncbi:MAG: hypothetical protein H7335_06125 [Massilia sp.]|nr:hypothetical protein [Massilia sp.]